MMITFANVNLLNLVFNRKKNKNEIVSVCLNDVLLSNQFNISTKPYILGSDYKLSSDFEIINDNIIKVTVKSSKRNIDFSISYKFDDDTFIEKDEVKTGYYLPKDYKEIGIVFVKAFVMYQYLVNNYWSCFNDESQFFQGVFIRSDKIEGLKKLCKIKGVNDEKPVEKVDSYVPTMALTDNEMDFIKVNKYLTCRTREISSELGIGQKLLDFINSDEYDNRKWMYNFSALKEDLRTLGRDSDNLYCMIERLEDGRWLMNCSNDVTNSVTKVTCNITLDTDDNLLITGVDIDHKHDEKEENPMDTETIELLHREFMFWHVVFIYSLLKNDYLFNHPKGKRIKGLHYENKENMWDAAILTKLRSVKRTLKKKK